MRNDDTAMYLLMLTVALLTATVLALVTMSVPSVGGTEVPRDLDCEEDEAITFTGPDTLECVHIDNL